MDYALLAATALGAVGLYLMLPRERAPLARLGTLLGAMALAGFFLFLVQTAAHWIPRAMPAPTTAAGKAVVVTPAGAEAAASMDTSNTPPVYFYLFAAIMIAGAVAVICQPRPVYAALYFVMVTLAGAGMFVLLLAEFMAIVLIIIYAGAILVTYVFVIMLASQGSGGVAAPVYDRRANGSFVAVVVAFVLVGTILQVLLPTQNAIAVSRAPTSPDALMVQSVRDLDPAAVSNAINPTNVQVIGVNLYSRYSLSLELAGILLTIALVGAVVIARKNTVETQTLGTGGLPVE